MTTDDMDLSALLDETPANADQMKAFQWMRRWQISGIKVDIPAEYGIARCHLAVAAFEGRIEDVGRWREAIDVFCRYFCVSENAIRWKWEHCE